MHLLCCLGDAVAGCDDCLADGGGDSLWVDDFLCSAAFDFTTESMANDLPELVCHVCWLGRDSGDQQSICTGARSAAFLDGVGDYVALFPFVLHRLRHVPLPEATQPLLTIMAAPASLCLTGYLASFDHPNFWLATGMLIFAQSLYFITLVSIRQYTRLSFYPSFAAFTFPLVISATALTKYIAALPRMAQCMI